MRKIDLKGIATKKGGLIAALGALAVIATASSPVLAVTTSTVSVPAHAGHAFSTGSIGCFSSPSFSNAVQNSCGSGQSWLIPIANAHPVNTLAFVNFFAGARNLGAGVQHCRAIVRSVGDGSVFFGSDLNITSTNQNVGGANVGTTDTIHLDCFFPAAPTNQMTHFRIEVIQ